MVWSGFALIGLGMKVGAARREFNVPLPTMYANDTSDNSTKFNCVQRGHQQVLKGLILFEAPFLL